MVIDTSAIVAILFDEPLTGLDPRGIRTLKQSIVERARAGAAIVISSHLLSLVEDLCTHLLILHHGRRLFFGLIEEARSAFAGLDKDASLEELFFRLTEGTPSNPAAPVHSETGITSFPAGERP